VGAGARYCLWFSLIPGSNQSGGHGVLTKGHYGGRGSSEGGARGQDFSSGPQIVGGSSKGQNRPGLHQTGMAQHWQACHAVTVAQNTVELWHCVQKRRLGFSSVSQKIPHEGLPIYRGFAPRSCVTLIQLRSYLQSKFEPGFG
jgi:hypothetical protein